MNPSTSRRSAWNLHPLVRIVRSLLPAALCCASACAADHAAPASNIASAALAQAAPVSVRSKAYDLVLDVRGASTSNGEQVIEWAPNQGDNQRWTLAPKANSDAYFLVNVHSGKCLDVTNGSTDNGALLQQWDCWGGDNQAFRLVPMAGGAYEVVGVASGKCIDAPLGIRDSGVRAQLWSCGGADNQQWWLSGDAPAPAPSPTPPPAQFSYSVASTRGGGTPVYRRPNMYDYAPTVMVEGGHYRMWWCASVDYEGGDHVFHAEADSLDGPWHAHGSSVPNSADDVFQPTYNGSDWDGQDTCDPSVLHVGSTYYLYYGGFPIANTPPTQVTAIGLATSSDGLAFSRVSSAPILGPARSTAGLPNPYGAGQPSAIYYKGLFYLAYTDTTGLGSAGPGAVSGAGIYVLRSPDPAFGRSVEELGANGFAPYDSGAHTRFPIIQGYTVDWAYSDAHDRFFMVWNDSNNGYSNIYVFDHDLRMLQSGLTLGGASNDGPGLAAGPDRHLRPPTACNAIDLDVLRAVGDGTGVSGPYGWDLAHAGVTLQASFSCQP